MDFLSINNIAFTTLGYSSSYIELIGTILGLLAVYWASRENIWTWPASLIQVTAFFILFYQINLYSDMFLQVYFFVVSIYGWYNWQKKSKSQEDHQNNSPIIKLTTEEIQYWTAALVIGTFSVGYLMSNIHIYAPQIFSEPATFPYPDAFTTVASIIAMIMLSRKQIENWILWIIIDIVSIYIYYLKDILFVAIEYGIFFIICIFGYINWEKQLKTNNS